LLTFFLLCFVSLSAFAQSDPLVDELIRINERAAEQVAAGNHEEAARLFQASLLIEELDVSYLNLGRSLALAGHCEEAELAYEKALSAPSCGDPSREEIAIFVERYRDELPEQCDAVLELDCGSAGISVSIDEGEAFECGAEPRKVPRGRHQLSAQSPWGARLQLELELEGMERRTLRLSFPSPPPPERIIEYETVRVEEPASWSSPLLWGGLMTGVGLSALGGALLAEILLIDPVFQEYKRAARSGDRATYEALRGPIDDMQPVNMGLVISGALLTAAGVTVLTLDLLGIFDEVPRALPAAWLDGDGGGMAWSWSW
jgi:hypothetical protein